MFVGASFASLTIAQALVRFDRTPAGWSSGALLSLPQSPTNSYQINDIDFIGGHLIVSWNYVFGSGSPLINEYVQNGAGWSLYRQLFSAGTGRPTVAVSADQRYIAIGTSGSANVRVYAGDATTDLVLPMHPGSPTMSFTAANDLLVSDGAANNGCPDGACYGAATIFDRSPGAATLGWAPGVLLSPARLTFAYGLGAVAIGNELVLSAENADGTHRLDLFGRDATGHWAVQGHVPDPMDARFTELGHMATDGTTLVVSAHMRSRTRPGGVLYAYRASVPPPPPVMSTVMPGDHSVTVTWLKPADTSTITGYTVTATPGGRTCSTSSADELSCTVVGLDNGVSYTFTVTAHGTTGSSVPSQQSNGTPTAGSVPGPVTGIVVQTPTDDGTRATLSWLAAASDPRTPVIGYKATASPGGQFCETAGALSCTITGLTPGVDYTFTVVAINGVGASPTQVPDAPSGVAAEVVGNGKASASWSAPASDGGSPVSRYAVSVQLAAGSVGTTSAGCSTSGALSCTVSGLTPGASYTFTVTATNGVGTSVASPPSAALVIPSPPSVTVAGVVDGATFEFGTVPTASCTVIDPTDGASTVAARLSATTGPRGADGLGAVTATCSYTDSLGLSGSASATYTVVDSTGPSVSTPDRVSVEATAASTPVSFTVTALDLVDGSRSVSCDHPSGAGFSVGTTTVTCSSTDVGGNSTSASFPVTVTDSTPPLVKVPASVTVTAAGSAAAASWPVVTATDAVDGTVAVTCDRVSGSSFPLGLTTVICTATDVAGNEGSGQFTVTVQDRTSPIVTVPAALTVQATGPSGATAAFAGVSAVDDVDGTVPASCDRVSGSTFPLGTTTVKCTASDQAGNVGESSFTVTVSDTRPPAITVPAHLRVEATSSLGTVVTFPAPTATDVVDGPVAPSCTNASGDQFGLGDTIVACTATDAGGNVATATFTVTITDTTAPAVSTDTAQTVEATGPGGASVTYDPASAADVVDGPVPATCTPASGSTFGIGTTLVTCTATDVRGNTQTATFTVSVTDTTAPDLTLPSNLTVQSTSPFGVAVSYPPATAVDVVDGSVTVGCDRASGSTFPVGTTTVTCTATDEAGNIGTETFTVTVVSGVPLVSVPPTLVKEATGPTGAVVTYPAVTATDPTEGVIAATCTPRSGTVFPLGTTTVTCTATNKAGATGAGRFTVKVVDTTAPVISKPGNLSLAATSSKGRSVTYTTPTALDLVDGARPVTCTPLPGTLFKIGTTTVTCTATDRAGNKATVTFTVKIRYSCARGDDDLHDGGRYHRGDRIRVKMAFAGDSASVTDAPARVWVDQTSSSTGAGATQAATNAAPTMGNALKYNVSSGQYQLDLDTRVLDPGIWQIHLDPGDGNPTTVTVTVTR